MVKGQIVSGAGAVCVVVAWMCQWGWEAALHDTATMSSDNAYSWEVWLGWTCAFSALRQICDTNVKDPCCDS